MKPDSYPCTQKFIKLNAINKCVLRVKSFVYKPIVTVLLCLLLLSACHKSNEGVFSTPKNAEENVSYSVLADAMATEEQQENFINTDAAAPDLSKKKIIRDGRMGILVQDLFQAKARVDSLMKRYSAYYANESLTNEDRQSSYNLNLRIPASGFDGFIKELEAGKGEVQYKVIDARDVTQQYYDLEIRLTNKRSYLIRYREILKQAKSVKEVLEVEQKIRELEEEIESTEGSLRYMADQVSFSSLNLILTKEKEFVYKPAPRDKFGARLRKAIVEGWYGLLDFLLLLFNVWPLWLILAAGIYLFKKYFRKFRRRKNKKNESGF